MRRENRYVVFKNTDVANYLTPGEREALDRISRKINTHRLLDGRQVLHCVVAEEDWPEYELLWRAIADRVDGDRQAGRSAGTVTDQQAYVTQLEQYVANVKAAVIDTFGRNPIACDGVLLVWTEDYNKLVDALNAKLEPPKP